MSGPTEAAGVAFFKLYGLKAGMGMIGAALLYFVLPPVRKDGTFDRKEFVIRLAVAGFFSTMFGDYAIALLDASTYTKFLQAGKHTGIFYLIVGAPGWWISRAIALWFQRHQDKDIGEVVREVKDAL